MRTNPHIGVLKILVTSLIFWTLFSCQKNGPTSTVTLDAEKLFTFQVYSMLESKCFACHGDDPREIEGKFDIRSLKGMLKGGESGASALIPGNANSSPIYLAANRDDKDFAMPPKDNDKLSQGELNDLFAWIEAGAPWPDKNRREDLIAAGGWNYHGKVSVITSEALSETWANRKYNPAEIWAFYPLREQSIPWVSVGNDSSLNPVDAFVNAKLQEYGLEAGPKADKRILMRRAFFDLLGLPPTTDETRQFLDDNSADAYSKLIDRLLDSPHYGEQWGRHWLDVVRYADSDGFANDYIRPNAWRYRDYVIRSFNEDKPYNEFIVQQIAGDELDPENPENLLATGFLRMGPWEHTSMSVAAETRQFYLDDITNAVGEVFLSQPLRCARCHDHKFDPIPTNDYYQIQAVFATTQFAERPVPFLDVENTQILPVEKNRILELLDKSRYEQKRINQKEEQHARMWMEQRALAYVPKNLRGSLPDNKKPPRYYGLSKQELGYRKLLNKRIQRYSRELDGFEELAFAVYNGPHQVINSNRPFRVPQSMDDPLEETYVLTGGSVYAPDNKVLPGILSALPSLQDSILVQNIETNLSVEITNKKDYRRMDFAKWMINPENPLTSRSIVNRVWQYHFGTGIAGNANNFGVTGKRPTHSELLDWLAGNLIESGWSLKALHRLIMTSDVYQRSSEHPTYNEIMKTDPLNKYLAYFTPRRLEAEEIRDAMLHISGELNPTVGGYPARPEIHLEQALQPRHVMGSIAPAYQPSSTPESRNRRSIYALKLRGLLDPMMEVFNQPSPELSCEKRTASSVTPQVFMLFNDRSVRDRSISLASRLRKEHGELKDQLSEAINQTLNRPASGEEIVKATFYWKKMLTYHQENSFPKEELPTKVEREMFEEMTGEIFHFVEDLDVYKNYQADLKTWEVAPETRALADFCIVLFNSNEFIYVY